MARYSSSSHVSFNRWLQLWDETGPTLTQRGTDDPNVPPLNFGVSHGDGECGLSNDGVYIIFPIFLGLYAAPVDVAMIPLPCVIDMVFFRKMAAFIAKIKEVTRIPSVAKHGPITWDYDGFINNVLLGNTDHLRHVNGFNDVIIERLIQHVDLVLNDWNGEHSNGRISHTNFFTDNNIDNEVFLQHRKNRNELFLPTRPSD